MAEQKETRAALDRRFKETAKKMLFSKETAEWFTAAATAGQLSALCDLVNHEMGVRTENKKAKLLKAAKFPAIKSIEAYDFSDTSFPEGYGVDDMRSLEFIDLAQDFIFYGDCGRGKTHLAIALGILATQNLKSVRFCDAAKLVLELKAAKEAGT